MSSSNPKIEVKPSKMDKIVVRVGWVVVALNILLVLWFYHNLPDTIPTHFNTKGEVDAYGPRSTIEALPIISFFLYFVLAFIIFRMKPYHMHYPVRVTEKNAPTLYRMSFNMIAWLALSAVSVIFIPTGEILLRAFQIDFFNLFYLLLPILGFIIFGPFYMIYRMIKLPKS